MRVNSRLIWESLRIGKNHQESARITENHWESTRINFRLIQESARIIKNHFDTYLRISKNWWESSIISENHWESARINENQGLDLFENQWESIPDLFENHQELVRIIENQWESLRISKNQWESLRIGENHQESMRIIENQWESISDWFENQWESSRINFTLIWESVRIGENHQELVRIIKNQQESMRIIKNHIKNKVLPLWWSKAKWHRYMKINVFIVILINLYWYTLILQIIIIFPLSQIHWIDHIAVLADSKHVWTIRTCPTTILLPDCRIVGSAIRQMQKHCVFSQAVALKQKCGHSCHGTCMLPRELIWEKVAPSHKGMKHWKALHKWIL